MSFFHALILGITEGLTEFIPVSSSGHLVIVHHFLGATSQDLAIDSVLQLGTILAVLVYFWSDLWRVLMTFFKVVLRKPAEAKDKILLYGIILGTIPAVVLGLLLEKKMETVFRNVHLVAWALIFGSVVMFFAERFKRQNKILTTKSGFMIGLYQCLALIPGVSRSGATISGGLFEGLTREDATRFSFLLSFPIIAGAGIKEFLSLLKTGIVFTASFGVGFVTAFIVGLAGIHFLIKYLRNHSLDIFVWYRILVAVAILFFL
jgi:undecaprenyl-diphosphatase